MSDLRPLSTVRPGQRAVIDGFSDFEISLKLMEMGCVPGEPIEVIRLAPLGDPMAISVSGYMLSLRKDEASAVLVRMNG